MRLIVVLGLLLTACPDRELEMQRAMLSKEHGDLVAELSLLEEQMSQVRAHCAGTAVGLAKSERACVQHLNMLEKQRDLQRRADQKYQRMMAMEGR